jgi:hypothetical protein
LPSPKLIDTCVHLRITGDPAEPEQSITLALRGLARRYRALIDEITQLRTQFAVLATCANPPSWTPSVWDPTLPPHY